MWAERLGHAQGSTDLHRLYAMCSLSEMSLDSSVPAGLQQEAFALYAALAGGADLSSLDAFTQSLQRQRLDHAPGVAGRSPQQASPEPARRMFESFIAANSNPGSAAQTAAGARSASTFTRQSQSGDVRSGPPGSGLGTAPAMHSNSLHTPFDDALPNMQPAVGVPGNAADVFSLLPPQRPAVNPVPVSYQTTVSKLLENPTSGDAIIRNRMAAEGKSFDSSRTHVLNARTHLAFGADDATRRNMLSTLRRCTDGWTPGRAFASRMFDKAPSNPYLFDTLFRAVQTHIERTGSAVNVGWDDLVPLVPPEDQRVVSAFLNKEPTYVTAGPVSPGADVPQAVQATAPLLQQQQQQPLQLPFGNPPSMPAPAAFLQTAGDQPFQDSSGSWPPAKRARPDPGFPTGNLSGDVLGLMAAPMHAQTSPAGLQPVVTPLPLNAVPSLALQQPLAAPEMQATPMPPASTPAMQQPVLQAQDATMNVVQLPPAIGSGDPVGPMQNVQPLQPTPVRQLPL